MSGEAEPTEDDAAAAACAKATAALDAVECALDLKEATAANLADTLNAIGGLRPEGFLGARALASAEAQLASLASAAEQLGAAAAAADLTAFGVPSSSSSLTTGGLAGALAGASAASPIIEVVPTAEEAGLASALSAPPASPLLAHGAGLGQRRRDLEKRAAKVRAKVAALAADSDEKPGSRCSALLARRREAGAALKALGNGKFRAKDFAGALALYSEAIECDPANKVLYTNRSSAHLAAGDWQAAAKDGRASQALDCNYAKAYVCVANALLAAPAEKPAANLKASGGGGGGSGGDGGGAAAAAASLGNAPVALWTGDASMRDAGGRAMGACKDGGNARFAAKDYAGAVALYSAGLGLGPSDYSSQGGGPVKEDDGAVETGTEDELAVATVVNATALPPLPLTDRHVLFANRSAALQGLGKWREALADADAAAAAEASEAASEASLATAAVAREVAAAEEAAKRNASSASSGAKADAAPAPPPPPLPSPLLAGPLYAKPVLHGARCLAGLGLWGKGVERIDGHEHDTRWFSFW
jgi:tetratricopeptide (TPR) repeat protein